ncbi:MAG TPA: GGDEF domain-containing response regulator [Solirubrobacteraceae bacterium]|nr:GGDEF domain-containing response regulator [Solirubrobacteraceae bacterium]
MIDHDAVDPRAVEDLLARATAAEYAVHLRHSLEEGLKHLKAAETACVLLDLSLPRGGLEAIHEVRKLAPDAAIVVITDPEDEALALGALKAGAQDYLVRGTADERIVARAVRYAVERKRTERDLMRRAVHDPLTNLPNRSLFLDRLGMALARLSRTKTSQVSVLFIDIDNFKVLNDRFGHDGGDRVLIEVARRLREALRPEDTVARFGGDEFVVLCEEGHGLEEPERVATRLRDALGHPVVLPGGDAVLHASVGISVTTDPRSRPELMLREADLAMYQAKQRGGGRYEIFDEMARERDRDRLIIETGLQRALERGELRLHYQPIVSLQDQAPIGVEALLRWEHPTRGLVPPSDFVELAEETGLIVPIGGWVLEEACAQAAHWTADHRGEQAFVIAVNVSPMQLMRSEFTDRIQAAIELTGDPPASLWLEVTETVVMEQIASTITALEAIKALDAKIVLDDFGTGYASLQSLRRFPIDGVKIDSSFIAGLARNRSDLAIVSGIAGMAAGLDLNVVAEGVETEEQVKVLRDLNCPLVQGMHFAGPVVPEEVPEVLARDAL